jgi:hypothetical protein
MSPSFGSYESDALAERRAQRVLNEKVGDRLPERSWLHRQKWYSRLSSRSASMLRRSGAASDGRVVSARRCCLFADRNLLDVRNGCSVDADSMAEHSIGAQREQAGFVLELLLHLIEVLLNDDRSPSGEVNLRRHFQPPPRQRACAPHPTGCRRTACKVPAGKVGQRARAQREGAALRGGLPYPTAKATSST